MPAKMRKLSHTTLPADASRRRQPFEVVYINLAKRVDRRREMEQSLRAAGVRAARFEAISGEETPVQAVQLTWDSSLNAKYDTKQRAHPAVRMTSGERGCCMSHAALWNQCASWPAESPPLLVLEDDVVFESGFLEILCRIVRLIEQTTLPAHRRILAYLGADVAEWAEGVAPLPLGAGCFLRQALYLWQTSSYVIWPAAARTLLRTIPIDLPIDNFISRALLRAEVVAWVAQPFLARQASPYCNGDIVHSRAPARAEEDTSACGAEIHRLQSLPGVGPKLAAAIQAHGQAIGGYSSPSQLLQVAGIGERRAQALQKVLRLDGYSYVVAHAPGL